jgi:hypothetical protein
MKRIVRSNGIDLGNNFYFNMRNGEISRNVPISADEDLSLNPFAKENGNQEPELLYSVVGFNDPDETVIIQEPGWFGTGYLGMQDETTIIKKGNTITIDHPGIDDDTTIIKGEKRITISSPLHPGGYNHYPTEDSYVEHRGNGESIIRDPLSPPTTTVTEDGDSVTLQLSNYPKPVTYSSTTDGIIITKMVPNSVGKYLNEYSISVTGEKLNDGNLKTVIDDPSPAKFGEDKELLVTNDGKQTKIQTHIHDDTGIDLTIDSSKITDSKNATTIVDYGKNSSENRTSTITRIISD